MDKDREIPSTIRDVRRAGEIAVTLDVADAEGTEDRPNDEFWLGAALTHAGHSQRTLYCRSQLAIPKSTDSLEWLQRFLWRKRVATSWSAQGDTAAKCFSTARMKSG